MTISVCIATHERPRLLARTLEALGRQTRLPDEVVVSDSSRPGCLDVIREFSGRHSAVHVKHVPSSRKVLPWHRWWAFKHSQGEVVLFMDDDITLSPRALETLEQVYADLVADPARSVAGIGFVLKFEGDSTRERRSRREHWLKTAHLPCGSVTPGGLTVTLTGLTASGPVQVDLLSGGAMSFRRSILEQVFQLDNLVALYEDGIGRGEDAVLSHYARQRGELFVIGSSLAVHATGDGPSPYSGPGWRKGMTNTWGRANTMRWLSVSWRAYRHDWSRLAILELARSMRSAVRHPWQGSNWQHLGGAVYGVTRTLYRWNQIALAAGSGLCPTIRTP